VKQASPHNLAASRRKKLNLKVPIISKRAKSYQIAHSSHIAQIAPYAVPVNQQLGDNFVLRRTRVCVIFEN
jgi:hypothetical protein